MGTTLVSARRWDEALAEQRRLLGLPGPHDVSQLSFAPLRGDPRFQALLNDPKNHAPLF